ncbi:MAG: dihydroorotase [Gammaproteobacteria bacterium]|nr:dihydroorotase [Gammaproteobacteria bacterium]
MNTLTLTRPDDWHLHLRDGQAMQDVLPYTVRQFARAIVMPNLSPPITTVDQAAAYRQRILDSIPNSAAFEPLMTLYLTDRTNVKEIHKAAEAEFVHAVKYYPAGATTHSDAGVTQLSHTFAVLEAMQEAKLPLLVHGESTRTDVDVFDREKVFIDQQLESIRQRFPTLPIVFEHITTKDAVDFVLQYEHTGATITPQHILYNRNALFKGGINPHFYCLPVLKREQHRQAVLSAATSGNPKFFLGTDSAPHTRARKESACGCAGIFSAHAALEFYAGAFEAAGALDKLEAFSSFHGPDFYGLPRNTTHVTLEKQEWQVPSRLPMGGEELIPLCHDEILSWKMIDCD